MFPSDPRLLAVLPRKLGQMATSNGNESVKSSSGEDHSSRKSMDSYRSSNLSNQSYDDVNGIMSWRCRNRKIRQVGVGALQRIDGVVSAARWGRPVDPRFAEDDDDEGENEGGDEREGMEKTLHPSYSADDLHRVVDEETVRISTQLTPLTRKPSAHAGRRGRQSIGETTPVETLGRGF